MKNIKKILIIMLLLIPCFVKADMSAPSIRPLEIVVVNPDGVDYYSDYQTENVSGHLNNNQKVYILTERYGYGIGEEYTTEAGSRGYRSIGYIKSLDGFVIVEDKPLNPATIENDGAIEKYSKSKSAKVYADLGVDLREGPSIFYKKITHIPKGTIVSYNYAYKSESGIVYIYTEYNGKTGWLDILDKQVLIQNDTQYIFKDDVETECGVIPKNTIQTPNFATDRWSRQTEFEYNGCKTLLNSFRSDTILNIYAYDRKVGRELQIHKTSDSNSEVVGTIPANTIFTSLAGFDDIAGTGNIGYVYYEGKTGWVFASWEEFIEDGNSNKESKVQIDDNIKVKKEVAKTKKIDKKQIKDDTKKENRILNLNKNEFVIVCVAGGVLLSLTAVVIIVLVNKKKKAKNNKKEEVNNTEESSIENQNNSDTEE